MDQKPQEVIKIANTLFSQNPDWVTFFREVLGLGGIVRQMYPTAHDLTEFEKTGEYGEIQQMLAKLRVEGPPVPEDKEPTRVITVRLPKSLHEFLQVEAHEKCTSMNQLCISKLVQWLDSDLAASKSGSGSGNGTPKPPRRRELDEAAAAAGMASSAGMEARRTNCQNANKPRGVIAAMVALGFACDSKKFEVDR